MRNRVAINKMMAMLAVLMLLLVHCPAFATEPPAAQATPVPEDFPWHLIETPYIELQFPKENSEYLVHEGIPFGTEYTHVFYIQMGDVMIPLFRLDFGAAADGDRLGWLMTETRNITVTLTVFPVIEEDFAALGEGSEENYGMLMMGLNHLLQTIFADEKFTMEEPGGEGQAELLFGTVELPLPITYVEEKEGGSYQAVFSCEVQGQSVALYTIRIGDEAVGTELGYYQLDGAQKCVSVEPGSLQAYTDWTDDDRAMVYQLMETINNVIQTIETSENFSIEKK